jgi:4'-phosphopantetheinyl transferase
MSDPSGLHPAASGWNRPPSSPALGKDALHVWRVAADRTEDDVGRLAAMLDADEIERAHRFHFDTDRRRFISRRGMLRKVLAGYLDLPAATLRYRLAPHGKPELVDDLPIDLRFSLSHSSGLALIAVARDREVGVDLERVTPGRADPGVARKFFAGAELAALQEFDGGDWIEAFFQCWTRKEAYIKARGEGLSFPLHRFEVSLGPDQPARILRVAGDAAEAHRWSMLDLCPRPGFAGAVVVERGAVAVELFDLP